MEPSKTDYSCWVTVEQNESFEEHFVKPLSKEFGAPLFTPNLTAMGGIPVPKDEKTSFEKETGAKLIQEAVSAWNQLGAVQKGSSELELINVGTNDGDAWSQDVYIVLKNEASMRSLNNCLAVPCDKYGKKPGFGGPSGKPHLSLMYGDYSKDENAKATDLFNQRVKDFPIFATDGASPKFKMTRLELWRCDGGADGSGTLEAVPSWTKFAEVSLE